MFGNSNTAPPLLWLSSANTITSYSLYTLTLHSILAFVVTAEGFDAIMSVTCKYFKRVIFIPRKDTWSAEDWPLALSLRLDLMDWGLPGKLITDRDPKFFSQFWTSFFNKLGVQTLYSTAYHPQTDGSSERMN